MAAYLITLTLLVNCLHVQSLGVKHVSKQTNKHRQRLSQPEAPVHPFLKNYNVAFRTFGEVKGPKLVFLAGLDESGHRLFKSISKYFKGTWLKIKAATKQIPLQRDFWQKTKGGGCQTINTTFTKVFSKLKDGMHVLPAVSSCGEDDAVLETMIQAAQETKVPFHVIFLQADYALAGELATTCNKAKGKIDDDEAEKQRVMALCNDESEKWRVKTGHIEAASKLLTEGEGSCFHRQKLTTEQLENYLTNVFGTRETAQYQLANIVQGGDLKDLRNDKLNKNLAEISMSQKRTCKGVWYKVSLQTFGKVLSLNVPEREMYGFGTEPSDISPSEEEASDDVSVTQKASDDVSVSVTDSQ
jgi:hypothetical protein